MRVIESDLVIRLTCADGTIKTYFTVPWVFVSVLWRPTRNIIFRGVHMRFEDLATSRDLKVEGNSNLEHKSDMAAKQVKNLEIQLVRHFEVLSIFCLTRCVCYGDATHLLELERHIVR